LVSIKAKIALFFRFIIIYFRTWWHTWTNSTAHLGVAAHRLRTTVLEWQKLKLRTYIWNVNDTNKESIEQMPKLFFLGVFAYHTRNISGLNIAKRPDPFLFEKGMLSSKVTWSWIFTNCSNRSKGNKIRFCVRWLIYKMAFCKYTLKYQFSKPYT
jgi:hypothetical protein